MRDISLVFLVTNERLVIEMFTTSFIRRSLTGAVVFAISILFLASTGCKQSKDTDTDVKQPTTTTEVSTTCTTTSTTVTTVSNSTTSSTTTGTTTTTSTVETVLMTQPIEVNQTIAVVTEPVCVEPIIQNEPVGYNEADAILIAQVVNKEASATYDGKLAVASVIVNRSNYYGQSITDVVYAPNQFSVVYNLGSYTADDYNAAVQVLTGGSVNNAYYFDGCHPDRLNHFRDINNNYIGAW